MKSTSSFRSARSVLFGGIVILLLAGCGSDNSVTGGGGGGCIGAACGGVGGGGGGGQAADAPIVSIAARDGENVLTLSPPQGSSANSFNVYASPTPQLTVATGTKIGNGVQNPFHHTGLPNGAPIFYLVTVASGGSESSPSAVVGGMPGKWTQRLQGATSGLPPARDSHTAVHDPGTDRMIVFGGRSGLSGSPLSDYWILQNASTTNPSWLGPVTTNPPQGLMGHTAVYNGTFNRMAVFGGALSANGASLTNALELVANANGAGAPNWVAGPLGPGQRWGHAAVYDSNNDQMIIFGGTTQTNGSLSNDVWVLHQVASAPNWQPITPTGTGPSQRCCMASAYDAASRRMILFGGAGFGQSGPAVFNDLWTLTFNSTFTTAAWQNLTAAGAAPAARCCAASVWDGSRLLLFGGGQFQGPIADDKIHALVLQSTTFGSADGPGGGPVARIFPTAVPAGRFLLFGGFGTGALNDLWQLQ